MRDLAMAWILKAEGGLADHPSDPGGLTNYGISSRAHPGVDVANLTEAGAVAIYERDYWDAAKLDDAAWPVSLVLFDALVQGPTQVRAVQAAMGVDADGVIGPQTRAATFEAGSRGAFARMFTFRMAAYASSPNWDTFGRGWGRRLVDLSIYLDRCEMSHG